MLLSTKMENKVVLETKNNIRNERNVKRFRFKMCLFISNGRCFFFLKKLLSNKYIKIGLIVNIIYIIVSIIAYLLLLNNPNINNDFFVYYRAGYLVLNDSENLYNPLEYNQPFRYLPFTAYLFSIFTILPESIS